MISSGRGGRCGTLLKRRIERISSSLALQYTGVRLPFRTSRNGISARFTLVLQLLTNKATNNPNVKRRTVIEVHGIDGRKGSFLPTIKPLSKLDARITAAAEVECTFPGFLGSGCGFARCLLLITLLDAAGKGAEIGGVGAGVVLDSAGALESGARVDECGAVDGEGTARGGGCDGGRCAA